MRERVGEDGLWKQVCAAYVWHNREMVPLVGRIRRDDTLTAAGWERDLCIRILERRVSGARRHLLRPEERAVPTVIVQYKVRGWTKVLAARQEKKRHIYLERLWGEKASRVIAWMWGFGLLSGLMTKVMGPAGAQRQQESKEVKMNIFAPAFTIPKWWSGSPREMSEIS